MKVLILSCNTGEGHNSAARAIRNHLTATGVDCSVVDTLSLVGKHISKNVSDMYLYSTRTGLFKHLYRIGGAVSDAIRTKSLIYIWNKMYSGRLLEYINSNGFDAVICVHLFPAEAITALRSDGRLDIPAIFVMTDYTCIPFLDETGLDSYVIPHEHLIEEFAQSGIPRGKLFPYGIPVDAVFHSSVPKDSARRELMGHFGWDIDPLQNWFLVMTGSMGFGNTTDVVAEILGQAPDEVETIVVCGRNEELYRSVTTEFEDWPHVHPVAFTDRIPLLMDACDVLFTKPGGISSTEAMSKHIPIIHTEPIPGCESRNAEFFHYHGMSYSSTDVHQQVKTALRLCGDDAYRNAMTGAQRLNARPDTCHDIERLIKDRAS